ncbi:carboxymuconolactone decarboxylase [Rhodococcus sp. 15-725-2-2b]|uniref:carboxymuconolactone decarboxylase family protein n=2 Tax=unclassified Rhodococcus (in: high G+C Gram-positive bacteria) TaxID=192944 RepID=UPI000B9A69F8|nr:MULTISPECIES: carboxymuconolactone decarboxylase family protein [unclassified Rhodococcus (in: high G+C Gram-positive bacteria)]OZE06948.1 carboxymuconolactone decarboxylase [Rhodococcus sp. 05-2255-3B1]OZE16952.1 carboxymuconolactone decarboxylase [Rhodococcus sp. 05-2255-3C]OZC63028.1 carboxymuconolactone decarboxylase [Rhodococcus sp. 06-469-3-2]OZD41428.1 carboxymuconolactone decarboxylase [Rhodococcus sp. 06-1477-1A]OZE12776.1 carboxymuconolactone decarboxylase [Rhodococcus sp. 05-2255
MSADDVRGKVERVYGSVSRQWELLIELDLVFAEAYAEYLDAAFSAAELDPHIRELLLLAHDASMTVLDQHGVDERIRRALQLGASRREILDVLELLSMISTHSLAIGLPLAFDPEDYGVPESTSGGYWDAFEAPFPGVHGMMSTHTPRLFSAYRSMGKVLWRKDGLAPKWRELTLVVADLSTTHLYGAGAKLHIDNARRYGATDSEIVAAVALTIPFSANTIELGLRALSNVESAAASVSSVGPEDW